MRTFDVTVHGFITLTDAQYAALNEEATEYSTTVESLLKDGGRWWEDFMDNANYIDIDDLGADE